MSCGSGARSLPGMPSFLYFVARDRLFSASGTVAHDAESDRAEHTRRRFPALRLRSERPLPGRETGARPASHAR